MQVRTSQLWSFGASVLSLSSCQFSVSSFISSLPIAATKSPTLQKLTAPRSTTTFKKMAILESPSAERNKGPIWDVLKVFVDQKGRSSPLRVLETAAGCGVHTLHFATQLIRERRRVTENNVDSESATVVWLPTDPDLGCMESINERVQTCPDAEVRKCVQPVQKLTLCRTGALEAGGTWEDGLDLIICINMIHISPWSAMEGLLQLAGERLCEGGILYTYGPYKEGGTAVSSNLNFDRSLRSQDPSWGVRDLEEVVEAAASCGLVLEEKIEMPANNLSLIFRRRRHAVQAEG